MSEWCEQTTKRTSEWPSDLHVYSFLSLSAGCKEWSSILFGYMVEIPFAAILDEEIGDIIGVLQILSDSKSVGSEVEIASQHVQVWKLLLQTRKMRIW